MNYFDAQLVRDGDSYVVKVGPATITPSEEKQARLRAKGVDSQPVTLGIRPEHVTLAPRGQGTLDGTVDVSEMMGSSVHLHVSCLGQDIIVIVQTQDVLPDYKGGFGIGTPVSFHFNGDVIHLFSKDTELNLEY